MASQIEETLNKDETPVVTLNLFRFQYWHKAWAFLQMGRGRFLLKNMPGLRFWKLMGTGKGIGFSMEPDMGQYGLLTVWNTPEEAYNFQQRGQLPKAFQRHAVDKKVFHLVPIKAHGYWSRQQPFNPPLAHVGVPLSNLPVAILTRATIAWHSLHRFWQHVPLTSHELAKANGCQFSIGLGEVPFALQATFSIWDNMKAMENFAYNSPDHLNVINKTRKERWYAEELFARFHLLRDLAEHTG